MKIMMHGSGQTARFEDVAPSSHDTTERSGDIPVGWWYVAGLCFSMLVWGALFKLLF